MSTKINVRSPFYLNLSAPAIPSREFTCATAFPRGLDDSGFEVEFKSSQTLYENEIVCKVEPHEFNFSTNPTSVSGGSIIFDINEDGKFDINDVSYIFKYILGMLDITEIDRDALLESNLSIKTEQIENSSSNDLVLTESEDVILMDLFFNSDILEVSGDREKAIGKLKSYMMRVSLI